MAGKSITNPSGANTGSTTDYQQQQYYEATEFVAGTDISAKQAVYLSTDRMVYPATTSHITASVLGGALNAISSGKTGKVIVGGYCAGMTASGSIAAEAIVKATTAGAVASTASPAAGEALGFAVAASASSLVDVWITKSL